MSQPYDFDGETFDLVTKEGYYVLDSIRSRFSSQMQIRTLTLEYSGFRYQTGCRAQKTQDSFQLRKNGEPEMITEQSQLERGYVEASNVDLANEMSKVIETQRAYQFCHKDDTDIR